jgi:DNA (cytosine-5)-methyltransferase 1
MDVAITPVREHRGTTRVWLQGNTLRRNGFEKGTRYARVAKDGALVLTRIDDDSIMTPVGEGVVVREVSGRVRNDKTTPIIDIANDEVKKMFAGIPRLKVVYEQGKITLLPEAGLIRAKARLDRLRARIASGQPLKMGSFAHGGGVLSHALEEGFKAAGVPTKLVVANEYREDLINQAMEHNPSWSPETISLCGPMQEFAFDTAILQRIALHIGDDGELDVLEAGIPCSGASIAGAAKRGLDCPEAHPEVGHLIVPFIALIARFNPGIVVLENVKQYLSSASMHLLRSMLRDLHYEVEERVIVGKDWNMLENRERIVVVGYTKGADISLERDLQMPARVERKLAEILEDIPLDDESWSKMEGLKAKEQRNIEGGKAFFRMQIFDEQDEAFNCLTKGLGKNRHTDCKIRHPENPELLRIPTPVEHARAKGIPEVLIESLSKTIAHELLGQSVLFDPFVSVGEAIGTGLLRLRTQQPSENELFARMVTDAVLARARQMARAKTLH